MPVGSGDGVKSVGVMGRKKKGVRNSFLLFRVYGNT